MWQEKHWNEFFHTKQIEGRSCGCNCCRCTDNPREKSAVASSDDNVKRFWYLQRMLTFKTMQKQHRVMLHLKQTEETKDRLRRSSTHWIKRWLSLTLMAIQKWMRDRQREVNNLSDIIRYIYSTSAFVVTKLRSDKSYTILFSLWELYFKLSYLFLSMSFFKSNNRNPFWILETIFRFMIPME